MANDPGSRTGHYRRKSLVNFQERERNGLIIRTVLSASPFERDGGPDRRLYRSKASSAEYEALETLSSCS